MVEVTVRATDEAGQSWDDPALTALHDLLADLSLDNRFAIVQRLDLTPPDQHYMQVYLNDDLSHDVEYREGSADRHFQAHVPRQPDLVGVEPIARVLFFWAYDQPGWREAFDWTPLEGL